MPRYVYKLGEHNLKLTRIRKVDGRKRKVKFRKTLPILSRALKKTGDLLGLDLATEDDIKTIRQITVSPGEEDVPDGEPPAEGEEGEGGEQETRELVYYKLGSWRADRVILVHEVEEEETEDEQEEPENQEGEEQQEQKKKLRRIHIPIPSWAPTYKVVPTLFSKARAAGLQVVGAYRHGYLIPISSQSPEGEEGDE
jgi:hypothetical protein